MQRGHAHGALQPTCRGWLGEKAHVSHKRSVVRLNDGASAARASTRWLEHASQYSPPQSRQWCVQRQKWKGFAQSMQRALTSSGSHGCCV
tara:strand:+ start:898 stop:1167 length:270 start_codon:yes stop_codon:yes gene_type:complete